ncbi:50S ribosomal protein L21 [Prosthecochloris sp. N3]|uniref:Large ribosomal subunit protein bL21 n=1 Tax=Prosthecochloris ethylica TaxID=2743976 RepID=A0ABR9XSS7_9CHLB|nr:MULTISPECIES: 50S ribosomal protein L21 [Prosthecochloris]MEC9486109.1 50S ribosomal protein L21 [Prosthecochloris sp.]MBF0585606.1 50S ribosomal protein L21 [Prosthecochloris ethylica]MBF0637101.1 50S ribosomal protein L21 [Prosthecochloris ethylica]NUK46836.1 50S ribosomal protein L21 [Prosthecochloris ethylica]RNA64591.1 50S ribosomal protein L21 [Prosthecochloris sp. ZM_2]
MQALIEISDKQYLVQPGDKLTVPHQNAEVGTVLDIKPMVTIDRENTTLQPSGNIQVKVLEHLKGDKVVVFKKKRRKRYQRRNGHRQPLTQIEVLSM